MRSPRLAAAPIVLAVACTGAVPRAPGAERSSHPASVSQRVLAIAHQGGAHEAPSNTMLAFRRAVANGADMLELDVHATRDGQLVVIHDETTDRTTDGTGRVRDLALAEVRARDAAYWFVPGRGAVRGVRAGDYTLRGIATGRKRAPRGLAASDLLVPTLREVLAAFPRTLFTVEIKGTTIDMTVLARLVRPLADEGRVVVSAFDERSLAAFRAAAPRVATALTASEVEALLARRPVHATAIAAQVPLRYGARDVPVEELVRLAHASGRVVHVLTVNERIEMERLVELGVDGIMTDRPTLLRRVLEQRGVRARDG